MTRAIAIGVVLLVVLASSAAAASPKLSTRDGDRLALANQRAFLALGLVTQHGCDFGAVPCINKAAAVEIAADRNAAAIAKSLLPKLTKGPCRQAVAADFTQWNRRASLVAQARNAWQGHHTRPASLAYFSGKWRIDLTNTIADRCFR